MSLSLWYSPRGGAPKSHWKANSKTSEGTAMSTWTIGKSIAAGFATVVGLLALMGGLAAYQIRGLGHQVTKITVESLPGLRLSGAVQAEVLKYRILSLKHLLGTNDTEKADLDRQADAQDLPHPGDAGRLREDSLRGAGSRSVLESRAAVEGLSREGKEHPRPEHPE